MSYPDISIILPAFNAALFIRNAIDSLLTQTFTNFELIIINDGSTDDTKNIILSYEDARIKYHENTSNKGLVYTLNKGIQLAKGQYIARMDSDDLCTPNRLALQKEFLDKSPQIAFTAAWIDFIDDNNNKINKAWELDRKTNTTKEIKKALLKQNCIAHPTIMGRKDIFQQYPYQHNQKNIEDYDLWLRLIADGHKIEKLKTVVLYYRLHEKSITHSTLKKSNFFFKHANCKAKFLCTRIKKRRLNIYTIKIFLYTMLDIFKGIGKAIKNLFLTPCINFLY